MARIEFGTGLIRRLFQKPQGASPTYRKNFATFRFGQSFTHNDIDNAMARIPLIHLISVILPEKAMGEGFDIVDQEGEKVDDLTDLWDEDFLLPKLIHGVQQHEGHGAVTFAFFKGRESPDKIELLAFSPDDVGIKVNEEGIITDYELTEYIGADNLPSIVHTVPKKDKKGNYVDLGIVSKEDQLANVFHIILHPQKYKFKGIPRIEKIWDLAHAHLIALESAMVGTIRAGYGIKKATIHDRQDSTQNASAESKMDTGLSALDSGDTSIIVFSGIDTATGQKWEDKIELETGDMQFDYAEKIDIYHKIASFLTGLPKNFLDGIFAGETLAGDIIYRMIQSQLRELREEWTEYLVPLVERWCELKGLSWQPGYKLEWRMPKAKLTEKEEAEIENIQAQTQAILLNNGIKDIKEVRTTLEIKPYDYKPEAKADLSMSVEGLLPESSDKQTAEVTAP